MSNYADTISISGRLMEFTQDYVFTIRNNSYPSHLKIYTPIGSLTHPEDEYNDIIIHARDMAATPNYLYLAGERIPLEPLTSFNRAFVRLNLNVPTGIAQRNGFSEDLFSVYPNPAADWVYVRPLNQTKSYSIEVYSTTGSLVVNTLAELGVQAIEISDLPLGMYIMHIEQGDKSYIKKLAVQ